MPPGFIPSTTSNTEFSPTSEPPSQRCQDPLVEALTTLAIDQSAYSYFSLFCGYSKNPYIYLVLAECAVLIGIAFYGTSIVENLTLANPYAWALIISAIVQGIGYCFGEMVYRWSSKKIISISSELNKFHFADNLVMAKNCLLIFFCSLMYIKHTGTISDMFYAAAYAVIVLTIQEMVATSELHKGANWVARKLYTFSSYIKKEFTLPRLVGSLVTILLLGNTSLYGLSAILTSSASLFFVILSQFVGLFEQVIIYEYAYRFSYYAVEFLEKPYAVMTRILKHSMDTLYNFLHHETILENSF